MRKYVLRPFSFRLGAYQANKCCRHQMDRYPSSFRIDLPTPVERSSLTWTVTTKAGEESQDAEVHTGGRIPGSMPKSFHWKTNTKRLGRLGQNQANRISWPTGTNYSPTWLPQGKPSTILPPGIIWTPSNPELPRQKRSNELKAVDRRL